MTNNLFRRTLAENLSSLIATFRSQINHVISSLNDIEVMLDDEHAMPGIDEPVEAVK